MRILVPVTEQGEKKRQLGLNLIASYNKEIEQKYTLVILKSYLSIINYITIYFGHTIQILCMQQFSKPYYIATYKALANLAKMMF